MEGPVRCHKEKQTLGIKYCSFGFVKRANQICKEVIKKPVDIYVLWFLSRVHSASVLPTSNMLCGFSKICWDPVLWRC